MTYQTKLVWTTTALLALLATQAVQAQAQLQAPPATSGTPPAAPNTAAQPLGAPPPGATAPAYQAPYPGSAPPAYQAPYPSSAPPAYQAPYPGSAPPVAAPYPGAVPYVAGPDAARNGYVQSLLLQRQSVLARPVGLTGPITLMAVGVGVAVLGSTMASVLDDCDNYDGYESCTPNGGVIAGVLMAIGGSVVATVGTAQLIGRLVRRGRQKRDLLRIDSELNGLGVTASLAPWLTRTAQSSGGGLTARLRF